MSRGDLSVKYVAQGWQFALYDDNLLHDWWYVDDLSAETIETLLKIFNGMISAGADRETITENMSTWLGSIHVPF